ncbi:MAG: phage holin family protein [Candidatus Magasanikbacteria bacterium]|nr:phage holin family protein [Candidatus Magasanikbacteria bacterium]
MSLLLQWILGALSLILVTYLVPGISVANFYSALLAALVLGLVNALIRPVLIILTLPVNILTLGLFTLVINALMFLLASSIVKGFNVSGFWPAFFGALVVSIISWLLNSIFNK